MQVRLTLQSHRLEDGVGNNLDVSSGVLERVHLAATSSDDQEDCKSDVNKKFYEGRAANTCSSRKIMMDMHQETVGKRQIRY